jgi:vancomycin resistance protein YoaR
LNRKPVLPKLTKTKTGIELVTGTSGVEVKKDILTQKIVESLGLPGEHGVEIPLMVVDTKENADLVNKAKTALTKWGDRKLRLKFRDFENNLSQEGMLSLWGLINEPIDSEAYNTLVDGIKEKVETEPKDAVFVFEDNKVNEFKPEVVGATIDLPAFKNKLAEYLVAAEDNPLEIPVILTYPKIRAGDINNLGIKELIGTGKSLFLHSIPGRVFNVNLAASRVNGTVVAPGEEFSFNNAVGEISKTTGYQTAYVISGGRTVLGDGGGVCQVSTTVFRAALTAGLPITERKAHAYRVGYYEQDSGPGIDATIFSPSVDLKFLNDTGHHILVQTTVDTKNLTMKVDIYGTSDGRKATISTPKISSQTPPPATIYTDDPTLRKGTLKQIDWAAWGAKVSFDYKVEKDGVTTIEKTFFSNYQPWQAIYLRGTGE